MIWCEYIGGNKKHLSDKINYMYKMGIIKQINVEDQTYYFYNDIIELENFDSSLLKIDKKIQRCRYLQYWMYYNYKNW